MSLYNSAKYLREAMDSVLAQTFTNFEFIIIDDGSIDDGVEIVRSYNDARIHVFCQKNMGLPAALNRAISVAQAPLIARMDPDDVCVPERLQKQYEYLNNNQDVALVGSAAMYMLENGDDISVVHMKPYIEKKAITMPETPCIHPTAMFRKSAWEHAEGYCDAMRYGGEDAVLFNRMILFSAVANLQDVLLHYRLSSHSMSRRSTRFTQLLREMIAKQVLNKPIFQNDWNLLIQEYQIKTGGEFGYNLSVGKLLLFRANDMKNARVYLWRAIRLSPASMHTWICLLSSYIPLDWRVCLKRIL